MSRDPILDEVRAIRDAIAQEHDYDLESIFNMLREAETKSATVHVSPPPPEVNLRARVAQQSVEPDGSTSSLSAGRGSAG